MGFQVSREGGAANAKPKAMKIPVRHTATENTTFLVNIFAPFFQRLKLSV